MTDMKRTTVSFPDEIVQAISRLKDTDEYRGCSDSEIIRRLVQHGLEKDEPTVE